MSDNNPFSKEGKRHAKYSRVSWKLGRFISTSLHSIFLFLIPDDPLGKVRNLPSQYLYSFGSLIISIVIVLFLYFLITGFTALSDTQFLAPIENSGVESKYCSEALYVNTGTYFASNDGYWSGSSNFKFSNAVIMLTAINLQLSTESFRQSMNLAYQIFDAGFPVFSTSDLARNILRLCVSRFPLAGTEGQIFFLGSPQVIFAQQAYHGSLSNVFGDCQAESMVDYYQPQATLEMRYQVGNYANASNCASIATYDLFQARVSPSEDLKIRLDIRSVITAVAVNLDILPRRALLPGSFSEQTTGTSFGDLGGFDSIEASLFFDPRFPGMTPISCIEDIQNQSVCSLANTNGRLFFPLFHHIGTNTDLPVKCDCNELEKSKNATLCNDFTFLISLLFFPNTELYDPRPFLELRTRFKNYEEMNDASFRSVFISSGIGRYFSTQYDSLLNTPAYRADAFDWCNTLSGGPCSLATFTVIDKDRFSASVTDFYFQFPFGACLKEPVVSKESWDMLTEVPFAPLLQPYQTCSYDRVALFFNVLGATVGNIQLAGPVIVVLVYLLFLFLFSSGFLLSNTVKSRRSSSGRSNEPNNTRFQYSQSVNSEKDVESLMSNNSSMYTSGGNNGAIRTLESYKEGIEEEEDEPYSYKSSRQNTNGIDMGGSRRTENQSSTMSPVRSISQRISIHHKKAKTKRKMIRKSFLLGMKGSERKREYSDKSKRRALDALLTALLVTRDRQNELFESQHKGSHGGQPVTPLDSKDNWSHTTSAPNDDYNGTASVQSKQSSYSSAQCSVNSKPTDFSGTTRNGSEISARNSRNPPISSSLPHHHRTVRTRSKRHLILGTLATLVEELAVMADEEREADAAIGIHGRNQEFLSNRISFRMYQQDDNFSGSINDDGSLPTNINGGRKSQNIASITEKWKQVNNDDSKTNDNDIGESHVNHDTEGNTGYIRSWDTSKLQMKRLMVPSLNTLRGVDSIQPAREVELSSANDNIEGDMQLPPLSSTFSGYDNTK